MAVLVLIIIFVLGMLGIIPGDLFVGLVILWTFAALAFPTKPRRHRVKAPDHIELPIGLGGFVADRELPCDPCGYGGTVPVGQSNRALLALMKTIERECAPPQGGDATIPVKSIDRKITGAYQGKSDDIYEEPMACYPQETRHE